MFGVYLKLGWQHILDMAGYDHILFVVALCILFSLSQWREVLILVTAFTLGHSVTLFLSVFELVTVDAGLIETLIPLTILLTALHNIYVIYRDHLSHKLKVQYWIAALFGTIHGFGFSNFFKAISPDPAEMAISFFAFNLGVELGQLLIVIATLSSIFMVRRLLPNGLKAWRLCVSVAVAILALWIIFS